MKARINTRFVSAIALGVVASTALAGCGMAERQQAAAIVNGRVISEQDVQTTVNDLKAYEVTEKDALMLLIAAPFYQQAWQKSGNWVKDANYNALLTKVSNPSESTLRVTELVSAINSGKLTQADDDAYAKAIKSANIKLNPKYGTLSSAPAPIYFQIGNKTPSWIKDNAPANGGASTEAPVPAPAPAG